MSAAVPAVYRCRIGHARKTAPADTFTYEHDLWLVDVDRLPGLPLLARFAARDHLGDSRSSIRANVDSYLARRGIALSGGRVLLLTTPRALGYVFNPLSLFWCHRPGGELACVIAEVHNTYGQRHCYLLRPDTRGRAETDKDFYVSPFLGMHGRYRLHVPEPDDRLDISVHLVQDEVTTFAATMRGTARPAGPRTVLAGAIRHPFATYRVAGLIRYRGIRLLIRRARFHTRPSHRIQDGVG